MADYFIKRDENADYRLEAMGKAILKHELKAAAYLLFHATTPAYRASEIAEAMAFVQGSGLEHVIATFGLEVDAGSFREAFFNWCAHRKAHHGVVERVTA